MWDDCLRAVEFTRSRKMATPATWILTSRRVPFQMPLAAALGGKAVRLVGSCSALDDRSPAPRDGLPGGLIRRFERDGNVPAGYQEQGHLQQGVADGHRLDEGAH